MYEVRIPGWSTDSLYAETGSLKEAMLQVEEARQDTGFAIVVDKVIAFKVFGWRIKGVKQVYTTQ